MTGDETHVSARRAARDAEAARQADALAPTDADGETRLSRRRLAESATQPATQPSTEPMDISDTVAPRRRPRSRAEDQVLRPPADLASPEEDRDATRSAAFGGPPQHYYPRIRHTQSATGAGVWPQPPRLDAPPTEHQPQVLDAAGRAERTEERLVSRRRRTLALVAGSVVAVAAAVAVALTLL
ncbi:hypothetical protein [Demequina subtropica]|uniref:hypothetical protein n=1 Tax=Demequina subtropica TaxID=1638989 RepID=UPI000784AAEC|nr:hypothetical protein [Demequina subtropica]